MTQYDTIWHDNCMLLLIQLAHCRFLWPYMALVLLWVCHQKDAVNVFIQGAILFNTTQWRRQGKGLLLWSSRQPCCLRERNVERALVAPSTWPTLGGLECLHLEALHSIFCWSICQPFQGRDSSGIALWGWWRRCWLITLMTFHTNQCPMLYSGTQGWYIAISDRVSWPPTI